MSGTWVVIIFAILFVALFVVGMSLTLIFKGHHIKSEIGDNENMKALGIKCAVHEAREEQGGDSCNDNIVACDGSCSSCPAPEE